MPEHVTTSSGSSYVEVSGSAGQVWRFAAGTKAGFAVTRIRSKLGAPAQDALYIVAAKDNEEPVEFGPDAELVTYGENWTLKAVQEPAHKQCPQVIQDKVASPIQKDLISEFYPGGKVPRGSKAELSTALRFFLERLPTF